MYGLANSEENFLSINEKVLIKNIGALIKTCTAKSLR